MIDCTNIDNLTMLDDFKKKYPNAKLEEDGTPEFCPDQLDYTEEAGCPKKACGFYMDCDECWNRPYQGEEEQK